MKKHIHKKCTLHIPLPDEVVSVVRGKGIQIGEELTPKDIPSNYTGILITEDGTALLAFRYNDNGRVVMIPETDPILVNFDTAYHNFKHLKQARITLLDHFKGKQTNEDYINALYAYYGCVNTFVILLFTAYEAFVNHNIPSDYLHRVDTKKRQEIYNKEQIMWLTIETKLEILNEVFRKDFEKQHNSKFQHIDNLKQYRNSLVHVKPEQNTNTAYATILKKGLTFKFEETIDAVMDFMNFYKPGYIDYCPCLNDF